MTVRGNPKLTFITHFTLFTMKNASHTANVSGKTLAVTKDPLAHLFFCEMLIEEYESLEQLPLDSNELSAIKAEINAFRIDPKGSESDFDGQMVRHVVKHVL